MPIPFEKLTLKDILYHQAAYEYFDDCGKHMFDEWDIQGLEKAVLGAGDNHFLYMAEKIKAVPTLLHHLNETMPSLRNHWLHYYSETPSTDKGEKPCWNTFGTLLLLHWRV